MSSVKVNIDVTVIMLEDIRLYDIFKI